MRGMLGTIVIAALMSLVLYRRFRRLGSLQRVKPFRMTLRIVLMSLGGASLFLLPWASPPQFGGALALGVALGIYAVTRVEFEQGEHGLLFRSTSRVGTAIFILFTARLLWRMGERLVHGRPPWARRRFADPDAVAPESASVTLVLLFVVIGYAVCHNAGILIRSRVRKPARS
jgi:hypothetical protein